MPTLLYGGSFDPITNAHLLCAREAMERGNFHEVIFVPCGDAPHKQLRASFYHRLAMLKLAIAGEPHFHFTSCEGEWAQKGKKSFTIDTYRWLNQNIAGRDCWWLIGSELIPQIKDWHDFPSIQREMKFCVVPRAGYSDTDLDIELKMMGITGKDVYTPLLEISSTYVRERVGKNRSIRGLVPEPVSLYIFEHNLYRG